MAIVQKGIDLRGSIGNISFYKRKDLGDQLIARTKGGASRKKIMQDPGMEGTRRCNAEFGGRASTSKYLLNGLQFMKPVSDFNWAPALNGLLFPIQQLDTIHPLGQRSVAISRAAYLLEGFQLNRKQPLEATIHSPMGLKKTSEGISLTVPALTAGANFTIPPGSFTSYCLVLSAAWIPDMVYQDKSYQPANASPLPEPHCTYTDWRLTTAPAAACTMQLPVPDMQATHAATIMDTTLMVCVGILLGRPFANGSIEPVKHIGAGKIMAMYSGIDS